MKNIRGFTLIELIVVIVILGVLAVTAAPKFLNLQGYARLSAMEGLKASLETANNIIYGKAAIAHIEAQEDATLSSGIEVHWGYPRDTQTNLRRVINIDEQSDWKLSGSNPVIFTFLNETEDMLVSEITSSTSICKLTFKEANKGERPIITISGTSCVD